eukprot:IDg15998t1
MHFLGGPTGLAFRNMLQTKANDKRQETAAHEMLRLSKVTMIFRFSLPFALLLGSFSYDVQAAEVDDGARACNDILPTLEVRAGIEVDVARLFSFAAASRPFEDGKSLYSLRAEVAAARIRCGFEGVPYTANAMGLRAYHGDCFRLTRTISLLRGATPRGGQNAKAVAAALALASAPVNAGCVECPCVVGINGACVERIGVRDLTGVCKFATTFLFTNKNMPEETALAEEPEPSTEPSIRSRVFANIFRALPGLVVQEDDELPSPTAELTLDESSSVAGKGTGIKEGMEMEPAVEETPEEGVASSDASSPFILNDEPYPSPEAKSKWLSAGQIG